MTQKPVTLIFLSSLLILSSCATTNSLQSGEVGDKIHIDGKKSEIDTLPFDISIKGNGIDVLKQFELSDVGGNKTKIDFGFTNTSGKKFSFDLKYKELPDNRSYPANLDITLRDSEGNKLGYLFFAINKVAFLKQMGVFGLIVNIDGSPVDIKFTFDGNKKGNLNISSLREERFIQDTLAPKFNFQMIRPIVVPQTGNGVLSKTYSLDSHPYAVNYTIKNMDNGLVQFQHNLYQLKKGKEHLLERVYFNADSIETMREAMYAGKYFSKDDGVFKLVFYPAMGQTEPSK